MPRTVHARSYGRCDVPMTIGQPDQGFEGYRFVGYNLYDSLILWDLSRADVVADLRPGLATSWTVDPADPHRWIIALRKGVKFHDGCDFTAADVVWNFERVTNEKAPQFHPKQFALIRDRTNNMEKVEALDDYTIALTTYQVDALLPYQLSYWFMISRCRLESLKYDYAAYQQHPSGTGPFSRPGCGAPHPRLGLDAEYVTPGHLYCPPSGSTARSADLHHVDMLQLIERWPASRDGRTDVIPAQGDA